MEKLKKIKKLECTEEFPQKFCFKSDRDPEKIVFGLSPIKNVSEWSIHPPTVRLKTFL